MDATEPLGFSFAYIIVGVSVLLALWIRRRFSGQRAWQVGSLGLFFGLFWWAAFDGLPGRLVQLYLASDPLIALVAMLAGRVLLPFLSIALVSLGLAMLMGRWFCGNLCPLGALFDLSDTWFARRLTFRDNPQKLRKLRVAKYVILVGVITGAALGFQLLGFFDPLVLFTRFSATLLYPIGMILQDLAWDMVRPLGGWIGWTDLSYGELILPSFAGSIGMALLLLGLLLLSRLGSRFFCRHLCPLGAGLGATGSWARYRRKVSAGCNACQRCVRECPTGAIAEGGQAYDKRECIQCKACVRTCPEKAVSFGFRPGKADPTQEQPGPLPSRRAFLGGVAGGVASGLCLRSDMLHPTSSFSPIPIRHGSLVRPPGALPEPEFLARCVRCGECMKACLTHTLQPDWYRAGLEGLWAPHMSLRYAACEQTCNVCGHTCPTGAIRPLDLIEKQYAKVGTAVILRDRCVAWAQDKRCIICDEQCPYNAIAIVRQPDHPVGLPVVNPNKCNGCGQCEDKCPVLGDSAIVVSPHNELRLREGSYRAEAKALGLVFEAKEGQKDQIWDAPGGSTPGFPQAPARDDDNDEPGAPLNKGQLPPGIEL